MWIFIVAIVLVSLLAYLHNKMADARGRSRRAEMVRTARQIRAKIRLQAMDEMEAADKQLSPCNDDLFSEAWNARLREILVRHAASIDKAERDARNTMGPELAALLDDAEAYPVGHPGYWGAA